MLPGGLDPIAPARPPLWRDRSRLRRVLVQAYRIVGPLGLLLIAFVLFAESKYAEPLGRIDFLRHLYEFVAIFGIFGLAFSLPVLALVAPVLAVVLGRDWRVALPLWILSAWAACFLAWVFLDLDERWAEHVTGGGLVATLVAATWVGYSTKPDPPPAGGNLGSDP